MECPKDRRTLEDVVYEGSVRVDRCPQCLGMWLDEDELEAIENTIYNTALLEASSMETEELAEAMAKHKADPPLKCPRCAGEMARREYGYCSLVLDRHVSLLPGSLARRRRGPPAGAVLREAAPSPGAGGGAEGGETPSHGGSVAAVDMRGGARSPIGRPAGRYVPTLPLATNPSTTISPSTIMSRSGHSSRPNRPSTDARVIAPSGFRTVPGG